jgi:8-oxo-dGTP pyrophosphatase MutT (NUDIX family)
MKRKKVKTPRVMQKNKPVSIKAAGGVLYRVIEGEWYVLLIYRNGVWDLPKGKHEGSEKIRETAAREVSEETGTNLPEKLSYLCDTYHEYREGEKLIGKETVWYSMAESEERELKPQTEEGITRVEWVPLGEAQKRVGYENLKTVLNAFRKQFDIE